MRQLSVFICRLSDDQQQQMRFQPHKHKHKHTHKIDFDSFYKNIARGTTDPDYSVRKSFSSNNINIWSSGGATCIGSNVGHQVATLADALLQIYPPG